MVPYLITYMNDGCDITRFLFTKYVLTVGLYIFIPTEVGFNCHELLVDQEKKLNTLTLY